MVQPEHCAHAGEQDCCQSDNQNPEPHRDDLPWRPARGARAPRPACPPGSCTRARPATRLGRWRRKVAAGSAACPQRSADAGASAIRRSAALRGRRRPHPTNPRLTTGIEDLAEAIRAWAKGWLPTEAAAELLISHQGWLLREDFLQVAVEVGWEPFPGREVAAVDFAAAADAVQGMLPCSD